MIDILKDIAKGCIFFLFLQLIAVFLTFFYNNSIMELMETSEITHEMSVALLMFFMCFVGTYEFYKNFFKNS